MALCQAASVVLLLYGLASSSVAVYPSFLSLFFFGAFIIVEARFAVEPIIPITLFKSRSLLLTFLAGLTLMIARWAVLFFTPVYAIAVRGWSPATAGLLLLPTNLGFGAGGVIVGWLHIRKASSYYL